MVLKQTHVDFLNAVRFNNGAIMSAREVGSKAGHYVPTVGRTIINELIQHGAISKRPVKYDKNGRPCQFSWHITEDERIEIGYVSVMVFQWKQDIHAFAKSQFGNCEYVKTTAVHGRVIHHFKQVT